MYRPLFLRATLSENSGLQKRLETPKNVIGHTYVHTVDHEFTGVGVSGC